MSITDTPRTARIARRAAELLEEFAGKELTGAELAQRLLKEDGLTCNVTGAEYQQIVSEVMNGIRVVDLRRAGHFPH